MPSALRALSLDFSRRRHVPPPPPSVQCPTNCLYCDNAGPGKCRVCSFGYNATATGVCDSVRTATPAPFPPVAAHIVAAHTLKLPGACAPSV